MGTPHSKQPLRNPCSRGPGREGGAGRVAGGLVRAAGRRPAGVCRPVGRGQAGLYELVGPRSASLSGPVGRGQAGLRGPVGQRQASLYELVGRRQVRRFAASHLAIGELSRIGQPTASRSSHAGQPAIESSFPAAGRSAHKSPPDRTSTFGTAALARASPGGNRRACTSWSTDGKCAPSRPVTWRWASPRGLASPRPARRRIPVSPRSNPTARPPDRAPTSHRPTAPPPSARRPWHERRRAATGEPVRAGRPTASAPLRGQSPGDGRALADWPAHGQQDVASRSARDRVQLLGRRAQCPQVAAGRCL